MRLALLLQIAAILHGGLLCAGAVMPGAINLRAWLRELPAFVRRLFWVYYCFLGFVLLSFGSLTWLHAEAMADGEPVARTLAAVMAIFWLIRCFVAIWVLDVRAYLTTPFFRLGNLALNSVFLYLTAIYAWTVLKGVTL